MDWTDYAMGRGENLVNVQGHDRYRNRCYYHIHDQHHHKREMRGRWKDFEWIEFEFVAKELAIFF